jgi:hypothetical protein
MEDRDSRRGALLYTNMVGADQAPHIWRGVWAGRPSCLFRFFFFSSVFLCNLISELFEKVYILQNLSIFQFEQFHFLKNLNIFAKLKH